jgi:hypothetical protein
MTNQKSHPGDPSAYSALLNDLRHHANIYTGPAYVGLIHLATLGGRLSFDDADDSLLPHEKALVHELIGRQDITIKPAISSSPGSNSVIVKHSSFGKLALYLRSEQDGPADEVLIGELAVDAAVLDKVIQFSASQGLVEEYLREKLDNIILEWHNQGVLSEKVTQVQRWINQFDALYTYIDRKLYSRAAGAISTLGNTSILTDLASSSPVYWTAEDRLFITAAHLLSATGGPTRLEEFNGKQLTALALQEWLRSKDRAYRIIDGQGLVYSERGHDNIAETANSVATQARLVDRSNWVRFRRINGLTLTKREHLLQRTAIGNVTCSQFSKLFKCTESPRDRRRTAAEVGGRATEAAAETGDNNAVQDSLELLLLSAVLDMNADFAMSSSLRDPRRLREPPKDLLQGVKSLKRSDFYCCVLPNPKVSAGRREEELPEILLAIARRMEYNRWHFIPGNYPDEDIPQNRHHFRPPLLPDLAEWSDLRHGGHVEAQVRYSMRLPGPPAWSEPLQIYGHAYRGIYDLRLFRTGGLPFTSSDLALGLHYCDLVDSFMKAVYKTSELLNLASPLIDRYTADWYRNAEWRKIANHNKNDLISVW